MATPRLTSYSFGLVTVTWGAILMDGFQAGEGVTITQNADSYSLEVGIDGRATRSQILDRSAQVTINLAQSSAANDLLSAAYNLGVNLVNAAGVPVGLGADIAPLMIRDLSGRALFTAAEAWIARAPDVSFDQPSTVRAWRIDCASLQRFDGGNN